MRRCLINFSLILLLFSTMVLIPGKSLAQGLIFNEGITATKSQSTGEQKKIKILQRMLNKIGFYNDIPNGQFNEITRRALTDFIRSIGYNLPPQPTDEIISLVRKVAWQRISQDYRDSQNKYLQVTELKTLQKLLYELGYNPGGSDGIYGPGTMSAIESFQDDQEIIVNGLPTRTVLMNASRAKNNANIVFSGTVKILNWVDYIEPQVLEEFERETKIKIVYDVFSSTEELEQILSNSSNNYDIFFPSATSIKSFSEKGYLKKLDKTQLVNYSNLDTKILDYIDTMDPGLNYSIPYMWGTIGLGANKIGLSRIGVKGTVDSLQYIFDPQYAQKLSSCGIKVLNSPSEIIPIILLYLGRDPSSRSLEDLQKVQDVLLKIKPYVQPISSSEYIDALSTGKICIMLGFSGDVIQARGLSANSIDIDYQIPIEGSSMWFDTIALNSNVKNLKESYKFLDYIMRPNVAGKITNYVSYANANTKSASFIDAAILNDKGIFPSIDTMKRLIVLPPIQDSKYKDSLQRAWSVFAN